MEELVKTIALSLVENTEAVSVRETVKEGETVIELKVAAEDRGKVIGKQGRIAKAIRTVVKAASAKTNRNIGVEIVQ
ncbi:MAG: KH domain-containing protein [Clostridiales Family XIII bacterium]|jgi:predicted RNA-binding protein YlqC (UPF0109 family)|nr:KH domain-containing protein [Clostridiales Family XIII bacterium]